MSSTRRKAQIEALYEEGQQAGYARESRYRCPHRGLDATHWLCGYDHGAQQRFNHLVDRANIALDALNLPIITDEALAAWNEEKNACGMFARDISLPGWEEEGNCLTRDFYVPDPEGIEFGLLRKARFEDFVGDGDYILIITDADHNEISFDLPAGNPV